MKFPYELSEQRLSLLSEDDRILYEYEHSPFYSYEDKVHSINEYNQARYGRYQNYYNQLNEDEEFKDLSEDEKAEMSKQLTNVEATQIYEELIEPLVYPILMETMLLQQRIMHRTTTGRELSTITVHSPLMAKSIVLMLTIYMVQMLPTRRIAAAPIAFASNSTLLLKQVMSPHIPHRWHTKKSWLMQVLRCFVMQQMNVT